MIEIPPKKNMSNKRISRPLLRFGVSFGAIAVILYLFREQLPAVFAHLKGAEPAYFFMAMVIFFFGLLFTAVRLQLVLRVQGIRLFFSGAYYVNMIALFFNNVLPSSMGGEVARGYYLYRNADNNVAVFSSVIVDRLFGLASLAIMGLSAILLFDRGLASPRILNSLLGIAALTVLVAVFVFNKKIVDTLCGLRVPLIPVIILEKLREVYQAIHYYRGHNEIVASCFILTFLGQAGFVLTNFMLAKSLSIDISLGFFFFFVPIILILGLAPSVNGIGVREATYLFYLSEFTSPDKALALSLLTTFFMILVGLLSGVVYAFKGGLPDRPDESIP